MGPYSKDLRERVAAAVDHGEGSQREIARRFRVSLSFVFRLLRRRRDAGTLDPKPHGGGPPPALGPDDQQRLAELIREQPDATLEQLRQRGGFTCSLTTLWRALRRLRPDPQEEDPARRRAGPARRPEEAPLVPQEGEADRARTAGLRGRDRGDHGDDPRLRLGPARRAGRRLGPRLVGVGDGDRGAGAGRGPCPAGVPGVDRRGDVPDVRRAGAGAGLARGGCGRLRQPLGPPGSRRGRGDRAARGRVCCRCRRTARTTRRSRRCTRRSRSSSAGSRPG